MDRERWRRVEAIFEEADGLDEAARERLLDERCAGDPALREEVASLLARADDGDNVAAIVRAELAGFESEQADLAGRRIGPYRLVRELGRGGMGTVWLAERADEQFEMRVAIKVVHGRLARPDLVERFLAERTILASLEHPNVARLLDGGTTDDGEPYVVMEHVDGSPIDAHCEEVGADVGERLRLFLGVCDAVRYAHRNLIVHRDLKPSNVLVTKDGVPKLLDFGIAKLIEPGGEAGLTRTGLAVFTPEYASPEQVRGEPVTTSSDVYSLGVLLHRLLTGRGPYRTTGDSAVEMIDAVRTQEPIRPSAAVEDRRLRTRLAGDLDTIVLTALHKEPTRRYASVAELADDVRAHLDGRPVSARPATWGYRASKFVRRNRALVAALATVAIVLVGATAVSIRFGIRADRQARIAEAVNAFLNDDLLAQADPYNEADREITLREVVDRAAATVGERFDDEPLVHAAIRATLGEIYQNLGDPTTAETHLRRAATLREDALGTSARETLRSWNELAGVLYEVGRTDEAVAILERVLPIERRVLPDDDPLILYASNVLALVYDASGRADEAIEAFRETVDVHTRVLGPDHVETLTAMNNLALVYSDLDRHDEAGPLLERVAEGRRAKLGDDHPDTVLSLASLGFHHTLTGELQRAEPILREAVVRGREVLGPTHAWQTNNLNLLADVYRRQERHDEAAPLYEEALAIQREAHGAGHYLTLRTQTGLALVYSAIGRHEEAERMLREVLRFRIEEHGADHPRSHSTVAALAGVLRAAGDDGEALRLVDDVLPAARAAAPDGSRTLGLLLMHRGEAAAASGRAAEAIESLEASERMLSERLGAGDETVASVRRSLSRLREPRM